MSKVPWDHRLMANTKRKRKTKHRGNAAGMVESRGRTGRKPSAEEKEGGKKSAGAGKSGERLNRLDQPPTWRSAGVRAVLASGAFFGFLVLFFKRPPQSSAIVAVLMIGLYTPLGFYTDMWMHRRRMRKQQEESK